MPHTKFYGSQIGGPNQKPYSYTGSPLELLRHDIFCAIKSIAFLPFIVWPVRPFGSKELCELYPSGSNLWAIFLHVILVMMQLPFILYMPFWLLFPMWWVACGVGVFSLVNQGICYLLNGSKMEFPSKPEFARAKKEHEHEQWIFLNGVAVGKHWLQSNVDRLALTFGRPVLGVHNKTCGILFDVVQCLIQRNFTYATQDVRACYSIVKSTLYKPNLTKVVFILHSQGGIEGGLIIDWLLQEVPQDLLAKLEIYTFGNAANHFNNPHLHLLSQHAALKNPTKPSTTKTVTQVHYHDPQSPIDIDETRTEKRSRSMKQESTSGKTIRYIEHYAHTQDFVAQWGVLHFVSASILSPFAPHFMGRVFERQGQGHQMNQHYLDCMFPLKRSHIPTEGIAGTGFEGTDEQNSEFMNSELDLTPNEIGKREEGAQREGLEMSYLGTHGEPLDCGEQDVLLKDMSPSSTFNVLKGEFENGRGFTSTDGVNGFEQKLSFKVRDLSRLWLYVNGKSPKVDETDVSIARMATI